MNTAAHPPRLELSSRPARARHPLALPLPELPPVPGVRVATGMAEIRYRAREDVMAMAFPAGTTVAGVFTRNRCPGAPVARK